MLTTSAQIRFKSPSGAPAFFHGSNKYGKSLNGKPRATNQGKTWTWTGSAPHPTRMHHYASLSGPEKTAWAAIAAMMNNDHSTRGVTTYNQTIAYMQTNLYRRQLGLGYTDTAPTTAAPAGDVPGSVDTFGLADGDVYAALSP